MKMGIIAAGTGDRLVAGGISTPKPLVPIAGKPLIARIIEGGVAVGVSSIACIVNAINSSTVDYLRSQPWPVPLHLVVKTTPSSMESLFTLAPHLSDEPFFLSTVDVVFGPGILEGFVAEAQKKTGSMGSLALTTFVDDEKPLWAAVDDAGRITAMGDAAKGSGTITAGFYYFKPDIFAEVDIARRKKLNALRQFLGHLVDNGYTLHGIPVPKTVDVDYPEDIKTAESYLKETDTE